MRVETGRTQLVSRHGAGPSLMAETLSFLARKGASWGSALKTSSVIDSFRSLHADLYPETHDPLRQAMWLITAVGPVEREVYHD